MIQTLDWISMAPERVMRCLVTLQCEMSRRSEDKRKILFIPALILV